MGVRNPIGLFTHAIDYELLVQHQQAAATKVKHSVKEKKMSGMGKKEERGMVEENAAAGREIGKEKRLRQLAARCSEKQVWDVRVGGCLECLLLGVPRPLAIMLTTLATSSEATSWNSVDGSGCNNSFP